MSAVSVQSLRPRPISVEERLRGRIDLLEEENRQLREALSPPIRTPAEWRLSQQEELLLACLTTRDWLPVAALYGAASLSGNGESINQRNLVSTVICHLRSKLKPHGFLIENIWGRGYRLVDRKRWAALIGGEAA